MKSKKIGGKLPSSAEGMWRAATAVAGATGVVRVVAIPPDVFPRFTRTTPAVAFGRGFPSLFKRGALVPSFATETN